MHVREMIRDEVVTRLDSVGLVTGRVAASRVYTLQRSPGVIVYTVQEEAQTVDISRPGRNERLLTLNVEVYSKAGSDEFDSEIDTICEMIEPALAPGIMGAFTMCKDWEYRGINIEFSKEGNQAAGVATLEYVFTYWVNEDNPSMGA